MVVNNRMGSNIVKLKFAIEKLQKSLPGKRTAVSPVPEDVKEGHFVVMAAADNGEVRRFIVPLSYLGCPAFLRLLEDAAEEYGFNHRGALTVPCHPLELEQVLSEL